MPTNSWTFRTDLLCAQEQSERFPIQDKFSIRYGIIKRSYGHIDDSTVGTIIKRVHAFDNWCKIQIEMKAEKYKLIESMYSEHDGIRTRSREDVIMIQIVLGERLIRGGEYTFIYRLLMVSILLIP